MTPEREAGWATIAEVGESASLINALTLLYRERILTPPIDHWTTEISTATLLPHERFPWLFPKEIWAFIKDICDYCQLVPAIVGGTARQIALSRIRPPTDLDISLIPMSDIDNRTVSPGYLVDCLEKSRQFRRITPSELGIGKNAGIWGYLLKDGYQGPLIIVVYGENTPTSVKIAYNPSLALPDGDEAWRGAIIDFGFVPDPSRWIGERIPLDAVMIVPIFENGKLTSRAFLIDPKKSLEHLSSLADTLPAQVEELIKENAETPEMVMHNVLSIFAYLKVCASLGLSPAMGVVREACQKVLLRAEKCRIARSQAPNAAAFLEKLEMHLLAIHRYSTAVPQPDRQLLALPYAIELLVYPPTSGLFPIFRTLYPEEVLSPSSLAKEIKENKSSDPLHTFHQYLLRILPMAAKYLLESKDGRRLLAAVSRGINIVYHRQNRALEASIRGKVPPKDAHIAKSAIVFFRNLFLPFPSPGASPGRDLFGQKFLPRYVDHPPATAKEMLDGIRESELKLLSLIEKNGPLDFQECLALASSLGIPDWRARELIKSLYKNDVLFNPAICEEAQRLFPDLITNAPLLIAHTNKKEELTNREKYLSPVFAVFLRLARLIKQGRSRFNINEIGENFEKGNKPLPLSEIIARLAKAGMIHFNQLEDEITVKDEWFSRIFDPEFTIINLDVPPFEVIIKKLFIQVKSCFTVEEICRHLKITFPPDRKVEEVINRTLRRLEENGFIVAANLHPHLRLIRGVIAPNESRSWIAAGNDSANTKEKPGLTSLVYEEIIKRTNPIINIKEICPGANGEEVRKALENLEQAGIIVFLRGKQQIKLNRDWLYLLAAHRLSGEDDSEGYKFLSGVVPDVLIRLSNNYPQWRLPEIKKKQNLPAGQ